MDVDLSIIPEEQLRVMRRVYSESLLDEFEHRYPTMVDAVVKSGFVPQSLCTGGVMSVVWSGMWNGERAVAKLAPAPDMLSVAVDVTSLWGVGITVDVYDRGYGWVVLSHGGEPANQPDIGGMLDTLERAHRCRPRSSDTVELDRLDSCRKRLGAFVAMALGRDASVEHLGDRLGELTEISLTLETEGDSICHGDPRDNNWLIRNGRLCLIDPDPFIGPAAADISRWILGGGAATTRQRAEATLGRDDRVQVARWLRFWSLERPAALAHHGWDRTKLDTITTEGFAAADLLEGIV